MPNSKEPLSNSNEEVIAALAKKAEDLLLEEIFAGDDPLQPRTEIQKRVAPIEYPTTEEEYLINRRALSVALKEMARRREAGEPRRPEDLFAEITYLVSATGYLDPETFDVLNDIK